MINPNEQENRSASQASSAAPSPNDGGMAGLVRQLTDDVTNLLTKEAQLAKAEIREAVDEAKAGVAAMGAGAAVAFSGVLSIVMGFTYALATVVPPWAAAFIVGAIALAIGYMMLAAGKKKVKPSNAVPERAINAVKDDAEMARRKAK